MTNPAEELESIVDTASEAEFERKLNGIVIEGLRAERNAERSRADHWRFMFWCLLGNSLFGVIFFALIRLWGK